MHGNQCAMGALGLSVSEFLPGRLVFVERKKSKGNGSPLLKEQLVWYQCVYSNCVACLAVNIGVAKLLFFGLRRRAIASLPNCICSNRSTKKRNSLLARSSRGFFFFFFFFLVVKKKVVTALVIATDWPRQGWAHLRALWVLGGWMGN